MTKEEFEAAARKYREEMFRLYARQPSPPAPMPPDAPPEPRIPTETPPEPVTVPEDASRMPPLPTEPPVPESMPDAGMPPPPEPEPFAPDYTPRGWTGNSLPPEIVLSGTGGLPSHAPAFSGAVTADALMRTGKELLPQGSGTLLITVRTADSAMPVEGATVLVTEDTDTGTNLIGALKTDENGEIRPLVLPAPVGDPNSKQVPFSRYSVQVTARGYRTERSVDVPVFAGVASMQDFLLIPLAADEAQGTGDITYYNEEPVY